MKHDVSFKGKKRMNPWLIGLLVVVGLALVTVVIYYLLPKNPEVGNREKLSVSYSVADQQKIDTVVVTPAELAAADGEAGHRCWLAVGGVVHDMSSFPSWARGLHHGVHCGTDGTEKFVGSGHGRAVLEKMPVVGRLGS